ncbi:hypothetical protein IRZ71_11085 [Flavobacterium sp. ANB]|uniref:hypothetical protein n=1 Tax=unclassified Flavobacterium TaxID=196869 RepID=UPI0012B949B5|nr:MULTISPECIES: hypothetical protein [unclassified Flavobacterium]MBF4516895.1 hypothetical protein [Flavobacterium sp. ANB]MTD69209.1 hypothetical protein [Flavobacterium sp. LC2016-13]
MEKIAKFVVKSTENINWMEKKAIQFYSHLFGQSDVLGEKYVEENLSVQKLIKLQNDFSIEILAVYDDETPLSFMKMNSSRLSNQNLDANKALGLGNIIYFNTEELIPLLERAEAIAVQRKHDLIWIKLFETDTILLNALESKGYLNFDFEVNNNENLYPKEIYLKKAIH